jgi:hypothetical protein
MEPSPGGCAPTDRRLRGRLVNPHVARNKSCHVRTCPSHAPRTQNPPRRVRPHDCSSLRQQHRRPSRPSRRRHPGSLPPARARTGREVLPRRDGSHRRHLRLQLPSDWRSDLEQGAKHLPERILSGSVSEPMLATTSRSRRGITSSIRPREGVGSWMVRTRSGTDCATTPGRECNGLSQSRTQR